MLFIKNDGVIFGSVLIGHWLFDSTKRYPTFVHKRSPQIENVLGVRRIVYVKKNGELKGRFNAMLNSMSFMKYAL